jgi:glycosyltransferase involved in cell wall biosynthesis
VGKPVRRITVGLESGVLKGPKTGVANYTLNILGALLQHGERVRFVGFERLFWREIVSSMLPVDVANPGEPAASGWGGRLADWAADAALRVELRLSRVQPARAVYRATYRRWFAATVRSRRLDLFHAFNFRPPADPGVPVLPVIHDLSTFRHPEFHPADRVRWLDGLGETIARAPLVQTISEFSKREIVSVFGYPAERIFMAPPAAAPVFAPLGREATLRDLAPFGLEYGSFFLAVGTLEPRKNIRTLVAAYAQLSPAERQRFPLVVVGGRGWGELEFPAQAERLRRDGTLRFLEGIANPQLRGLYEGARLLLMPSLYEGFGMPVVEALACGTAVAHSADTSMDEITGALGRRVVATHVEGWTAALREAIAADPGADTALREARIARARRFDWSASADAVLSAYGRLIPG